MGYILCEMCGESDLSNIRRNKSSIESSVIMSPNFCLMRKC